MASPGWKVFLSYNRLDGPAVEAIAASLQTRGIHPWLDRWNLIPGEPWQPAVEQALAECETSAIFIGPSQLGPWHNNEMRAALELAAKSEGRRLIPVLLPKADEQSIPLFARQYTQVQFESLDDERALDLFVRGIQGESLQGAQDRISPISEGKCPYRGLDPFEIADGPVFFGRKALTERSLQRIRDQTRTGDTRLLGILGASGSGKSSLAKAGVAYRVQQGALQDGATSRVALMQPGRDPVEALAKSLLRIWPDAPEPFLANTVEGVLHNERGLQLAALNLTERHVDRVRILVLVDQFEELFTMCRSESLRGAFVRNLLYAAAAKEPVTVLLTGRADFYGEFSRFPDLGSLLETRNLLVGQMTENELREAVEEPATLVGLTLDHGLADLLIADTIGGRGNLPLLSYALLQLWSQRERGRRLSIETYRKVGRLWGALNTRAEHVYLERLSHEQQTIAQSLFLHLAEPQEGGEYTRARPRIGDLSAPGASANTKKALEAVIGILAGPHSRLLTISAELAADPKPTVEVSHEALFRCWDRYRDWLKDNHEFLLWRKRLHANVHDWLRFDKDRAGLLRGALLHEAERWLGARNRELAQDEIEYIVASREQIEGENQALEALQAQESKAKRRRKLMWLAQVAAGIAAVGIVWIFAQRTDSVSVLLQKSRRIRTADRSLSLLLAYQANLKRHDQDTRNDVQSALMAASPAEIERHDAAIDEVTFSPDDHLLATGAADGTVALWDADLTHGDHTYGELTLLPSESRAQLTGPVIGLWFHDANVLAAASLSGTITWLNVRSGARKSRSLSTKGITCLTMDPHGGLIATGEDAGAVRLWSADGKALGGYQLQTDRITALAFSNDGSQLAAGGANGVIGVWSLNSPESIMSVSAEATIASLSFQKDGKRLFSASRSGKAHIWSLGSTRPDATFPAGSGLLVSAAVDSSGRQLAAAHSDSSITIWQLDEIREVVTIDGESSPPRKLSFSTDGRRLAIARNDGTARVIEVELDLLRTRVRDTLKRDFRFPFEEECRTLVGSCSGLTQD